MKRSSDRILTTHAGSLARPADLMDMLNAKLARKSYDQDTFAKREREAGVEVVKKQVDSGIDIVNDGEYGKPNFSNYARERLEGFEERAPKAGDPPVSIFGRDMAEFSEYFNRGGRAVIGRHARQFFCTGPLKYIGHRAVQSDIENFKAALQTVKTEEAFLPAVAPGTIEHWMTNEYYPNDEAYVSAIAEAMREEYKAIVDAGFILQIDDPDLDDAWQIHSHMSVPP